jgi:hypothetical protein
MQSELIFSTPADEMLSLKAIKLNFKDRGDRISECCLTGEISPQTYEKIDIEELFNLKKAVRTPIENGEFQSDRALQLKLSLKPDLLPEFYDNFTNKIEALNLLTEPSSDLKNLLNTENWLCLHVSQQQDIKEVGYRTFWSYISPEALINGLPDREKISQGIVNFFSELTETNLNEITQNFSDGAVGAIGTFFQELDRELQEPEEETNQRTLLETAIQFFLEDDWSFQRIEGENVLRLGFEGNNGQWTCFLQTREERQQLIFYSGCPIPVPDEKHLDLAEFITRANYGTILGNFELDFEDGEIRYKTSIDVEDDRLTSALIKQVVYPNVMMMDEYLPGILAVISGEKTPREAIAQIEG